MEASSDGMGASFGEIDPPIGRTGPGIEKPTELLA